MHAKLKLAYINSRFMQGMNPDNIRRIISRLAPIGAVITVVILVVCAVLNKRAWGTDENSSAEDKEYRVQQRGMIASCASAVIVNILMSTMIWMKVPRDLYVVNFGFIFCPVLGFMLDQLATDIGRRKFKENRSDAGRYCFEMLTSNSFFRYCITVLLDLFISYPLMDSVKGLVAPVTSALSQSTSKPFGRYDRFLAQNMDSWVQSFISIITFKAYTNQTRFNWAYERSSSDESRISTSVILLAVSISALVFSITYRKHKEKQCLALVTFVLLCILSEFEMGHTDRSTHYAIGMGVFLAFLAGGVAFPFVRGVQEMARAKAKNRRSK